VALLPILLLPPLLWGLVLPVWAITLWFGRYCYHHIGGYTGDCLGASQQLAEVTCYLAASALWTFI
jgi:adenosylcobinamide-GDP ribazoletransferase